MRIKKKTVLLFRKSPLHYSATVDIVPQKWYNKQKSMLIVPLCFLHGGVTYVYDSKTGF